MSLVSKHKGISHIILNGSLAENKARFFKSDIDISIILKDDCNKTSFEIFYKKRVLFAALFCPYFLPLSERLHNIYYLRDLKSRDPSMFRGYLKKSSYKVLFGEPIHHFPDLEIDSLLYLEDRILQILKSKKLPQNKLNDLKIKMNIEESSLSSDHLEKLTFIKMPNGQFLQLPIYSVSKNIVFQYKTLEEWIDSAHEYRKRHPYIKSIHSFKNWLIYIDDGVKVINQERLMGLERTFFIKKDLEFIDHFYLNHFQNYQPKKHHDLITRKSLIKIAKYYNLYIHEERFESETLAHALKIIHPKVNIAPNISLCVCTKNRNDFLCDLFDSIAKQTYLPKEVLLVNNGVEWSDEFKENLQQKLPAKIVFFKENLSTISALRNFCIDKATSEIVSFVDDDCILPVDWIKNVYDHFSADPELTLLGGKIQHYKETSDDLIEEFHRSYLGGPE